MWLRLWMCLPNWPKITQYGFRREEDFEKYEALRLAEQLASVAKVSSHEKTSTYDVIACTLREKWAVPKKQFKAVSKVDKSFKTTSSASSAASRQPDWESPRRLRVYCYACGMPGHRRNSRPLFPKSSSGVKPLMPPPGGQWLFDNISYQHCTDWFIFKQLCAVLLSVVLSFISASFTQGS